MATKQLTPKQLHFARCVASGMTQADAYREAYEPSDSTTAASIHTLASRLMADVEIRSRVDVLVAARERAVAASAVTDRDKVLSKLRGWMDNAEPTDTAKLRAAELLGKAAGLFTTEVNVTTLDRDASEVAAELQSKLTGLLSRDDDQKPARETGDEVH
jgi:cytoskeletal protein RodZ